MPRFLSVFSSVPRFRSGSVALGLATILGIAGCGTQEGTITFGETNGGGKPDLLKGAANAPKPEETAPVGKSKKVNHDLKPTLPGGKPLL